MPERRDFIAEEFRPWFGHLVICKVEGEAERFLVTLAGTEVVRYYGRDLTRKYLDVEMASDDLRWVADSYRQCARSKTPQLLYSPRFTFHGTTKALLRLLLPCGVDERVNTVISGVYAVDNTTTCACLPVRLEA